MDGLTVINPELEDKVARTIPGMAHWAGSGPNGRICGECAFFYSVSRGVGQSFRCQKYYNMMDREGSKKIPPGTPSCKYFELKGG